MKTKIVLVFAILSLVFAFSGTTKAGVPAAAAGADSVVWVGLDYSRVQMMGTQVDFANPEGIFPDMLNAWNGLFEEELVAKTGKKMVSRLETRLGKPVVSDCEGMTAVNKKASPAQIVSKTGGKELADQSDIADKDIAAAVKAYTLKQTSGVGLVFIVDRLVKAPGKKSEGWGALYTVFFDIKSREILGSSRGCYKAGGFGFRNYWFRPVKDAVDELK